MNTVLYKIPGRAKKLSARWNPGIWAGRSETSDEHLLLTRPDPSGPSAATGATTWTFSGVCEVSLGARTRRPVTRPSTTT
eukprot:14778636-Alexandrium_andersonii.AAC.1